MSLLERMAWISDLILRAELVYANEYDLQAGIHAALEPHVFEISPEHRLDDRDRPDFLLVAGDYRWDASTIAIEVKIEGSGASVLRQLTRYAEHDLVDGILLVTTRSKHHHIPLELNEKPVRLVSLIGAGL